MKKIFIFDLDGTLMDTMDALAVSTNMALERVGLKGVPQDVCRRFVGNGAKNQIRCALKEAGNEDLSLYEACYRAYREIFKVHCTDNIRIYDGIKTVLETLKAEGLMIAVHSNKPHAEAVKVIEETFGKGFFDAIQGQEDRIRRKPAPDGAKKILDLLGIKEDAAVYVGDSEVDLETGKNLGVLTLVCAWGFRGKQFLREAGAKNIIDRPEDLLHYSGREI